MAPKTTLPFLLGGTSTRVRTEGTQPPPSIDTASARILIHPSQHVLNQIWSVGEVCAVQPGTSPSLTASSLVSGPILGQNKLNPRFQGGKEARS